MSRSTSPVDLGSLFSGLIALGFGGVLVVVVQPSFRTTFAEFGAALPRLTQIVLSPIYAIVVGALPLGLAIAARAQPAGSPARAALAVTSMLLALLLPVSFFLGAYLPLLQIAGNLGAGP